VVSPKAGSGAHVAGPESSRSSIGDLCHRSAVRVVRPLRTPRWLAKIQLAISRCAAIDQLSSNINVCSR